MIDIVLKTLGESIRASRKAQGYTLEELSMKSGVNPTQLGKIERGERNFTIRTLDRILEALELDYNEVFDIERKLVVPENPMIHKTVSQLKSLTIKEQRLIYNTASMLAHKNRSDT